MKVELDVADVETLLFATGVTKAMEAAVKATTADEQFRGAKPKITGAHDRVAKAWREALRRDSFPQRFAPPDELQRHMLVGLAANGAAAELGMEVDDMAEVRHRSMVAAGLLDFGSHEQRVVWGSGDITWKPSKRRRMRLTERARHALGGILDLTDRAPRRRWWHRLWERIST